MRLWFGGGEISKWRALLRDQQVSDVSMSYVGLSRKVKFAKPWLISEHFGPEQNVLLDSGGYTVNTGPKVLDPAELTTLISAYEDFVGYNLDAVQYVIEMDALALGPALLRNHRAALRDIAGDKTVAVWHPQDGLAELLLMAERWPNIAVGALELEGRDLTPTLVSLARSGTKLFGMAMTKPGAMHAIPWYSVHSTSWLSPSQYGDTVMWSRGDLKRYHKRQKDTARRRHRTEIELAGFDADLILADDIPEVLKLSLWSWCRQLEDINKVTNQASGPSRRNAETAEEDVAHPGAETGNERVTHTPRQRPTEPVPGVAVELLAREGKDADGAPNTREIPVLRAAPGTMRACDTCYIKDACERLGRGYEAGAMCKYDVSVSLSSEEQLDALLRMLMEHETADYLRLRFEEELLGGGDSTRSERARRNISMLLKLRRDLHSSGFTLKVSGHGPALSEGPGFFSRVFGAAPAQIAPYTPAPALDERFDVLDAEVVGESVE